VAVEGKQKENDGEKGDGFTTTRHDDERRPFFSGTDKNAYRSAGRALFVTIVSLPLRYLVQSSDSMSLFLQMIVMVIDRPRMVVDLC
jgi:hypothetical protein